MRIKAWWVAFCSLLAATGACAAEPTRDGFEVGSPPCVGLVLGGGGARGAAHIGVLRVLERERVPVCAIAGTSMGAIVGSLYATGYSPDEIEAVLGAVDWKDVFNDDPPRENMPMRRKQEDFRYLLDFKFGLREGRILLPRGVVQGQKLNLLLRRLLLPAWQVDDFDNLPIPFRCVGTDIGNGRGIVFDSGDLAMAVRASMSVPGAFAPIRVDGNLMVDGGIVNNVPVDVVREMGADRVIVVDVGAPLLPEAELNSPFAISMQMLTMLMLQRTEVVLQSMRPGDISISPDLGDIGSADFDRALQAIAPGQQVAEQHLDAIRALSVSEADYAAWRVEHAKLAFDTPLVEFVDVLSDRSRTARYVEDRLSAQKDQMLDLDRLEQDVGVAYGQGSYERVEWQPLRRDGRTGIMVNPVDKGWGPTFLSFGLQISDDFEGNSDYSLAAEATVTGFNDRGGEWRSRLELGRVTEVHSELYQPWGRHGRWFLQPSLTYRALEQPIFFGGIASAEYRFTEFAGAVESGVALGRNSQLSALLIGGRNTGRLRVGPPQLPRSVESSFFGVGTAWIYDSLDDADFPSRGQRMSVNLEAYRPRMGTSADGELLRWTWDGAWSAGRHHLLLGAKTALSWDDPGSLRAVVTLGGFANLSSTSERQLVGDQLALARAVYYRRFGDMSRLFSVPAYIGAGYEVGGVWTERRDVGNDPLHVGLLFLGVDSPFGPIFLGYGRDNQGEQAVHLSFGSLLRP